MTEAEEAFKAKVFEIADGIRNEVRVTNATVRKHLKDQDIKCSYTRLVPLVAEWKAHREYLKRIEGEATLPDTVQTALIHLGRMILAEGAAKEQARAKALKDAEGRAVEKAQEGRDEVLLAADRMEEEIASLRLEVTRLHDALARAQSGRGDPQAEHGPIAPTPRKAAPLDPITTVAAELNEKDARTQDPDALLADIANRIKGLLADHGPCDASQLHFHLQQEFGKRAAAMQMPLEAGWLRHWLRGFTGPAGGLIEDKGAFDLASRTADAGAAFQARVMADVHGLLEEHGFPMALPAITKRLAPRLGQELRLTGGQLGDWMKARPDLFRKTAKGWFASLPSQA
ncbi:DNA-binding protein [Methylobacterium sp. V23]|uniref:DNA-binding protein n=1 Tax=Methylobacterium sp. V23 TaxID=2044878 RepID=UPI000CDAC1AB|nr:DNA-binding protein [Methylobacterium sp. V23]POR42189.1 hypothetical protein CRT23_15050 [Methylobacterium sp. V23]